MAAVQDADGCPKKEKRDREEDSTPARTTKRGRQDDADKAEKPETGKQEGQRLIMTVHGYRVVIYKPVEETKQTKKKIPGIVVLHGSGDTPENMSNAGFEPLADKHGFMVIYPSTLPAKANDWGYATTLPFFAALPARLSEDDVGLDASQFFVCGHSAGGTMALYLQNEMDVFQAAGAVEGAVGHLERWDMSRHGLRTMVIWNHADPVLEQYAPAGGEPAYYNLTVSTLRRSSSAQPSSTQAMPTSESVPFAERRTFAREDPIPELVVLSLRSKPGTHKWPSYSWTRSFDAATELAAFFLGFGRSDTVLV